jgi:DNA-binding protein H-NS
MSKLLEIRKQILELQEKEEQLIREGKLKAIEQIRAIMNDAGVSLADLNSKKKKIELDRPVILYRDGSNTWAGGRGRKPKWIVEATAKGLNIESFRINS